MMRRVGIRIIAGTLRRRRVQVPDGQVVRPSSNRLREALFSALGERVLQARVWDACGGSGALGIEALSRGARDVLFTDPDRRAFEAIEGNLEALGVGDRARVLGTGWEHAAEALRIERY